MRASTSRASRSIGLRAERRRPLMNHEPIGTLIEPQLVTSTTDDLAAIPPLLARRMLFTMQTINAFERAVIDLKGHNCVWGPIHISIGQEAIAAASVAALDTRDKITGSHRAHHITLAKILEYVLPGDWDPAAHDLPDGGTDAVYRTLAEIMGLAPGWCGGRGGSMHLRHRDAGVLGTNAIVAGGVPLSVGAALAERRLGGGGVVAAFMGDGAVNQGAFHEACNLASLWKLPVIFVVENNQYAVATSVHDATAATELVELAAAYEMPSYQVYGYDVAAIHSTFSTVASSMRDGGGPALVEAKCYRHFHHGGDQPGSRYGYRGSEEEAEWLSRDALSVYPKSLADAGVATADQIGRIGSVAQTAVDAAVERCTTGDPPTVRPELWPGAETVSVGVRGDGAELAPLRYAERDDFGAFTSIKYSDAIAAVTGRWMERDDAVIVIGEEVANFGGGAYGATKGLPARYPDRVMNTPISEGGFAGVGLGAAMNGLRPVIEIMFPDFTLVAADQIFNQIGKARHMYGNTTDLPLVLRTRVATGCGYGGQHSMDPVGLYALFPGWRIVAPADAFDYVGLFNTAMHSLDPVLILEHHALYGEAGAVPTACDAPTASGAPTAQKSDSADLDYCIPFGKARIVRPGTELTAIVYGSMVARVAAIADTLATEGVEVEVIDLRTLDLASIDFDAIGRSLTKTGAIATVEQAAGGQAIGARIAAQVTERFFDALDAPPGVITAMDVPNPVSRALESAAMIGDDEIRELLRAMARRTWK
ncbi:MAG: MFS transporter [Spirochaetaceae bacterium]|nr:MAG: MFS transporter [Spirochaetaceae bacterium]